MLATDKQLLSVSCTQNKNLSFAWKKENTLLPDETSNTLYLSNLPVGSHTYSVTISSSTEAQTIKQFISVAEEANALSIIANPMSQAILVGGSATFNVNTSGA